MYNYFSFSIRLLKSTKDPCTHLFAPLSLIPGKNKCKTMLHNYYSPIYRHSYKLQPFKVYVL